MENSLLLRHVIGPPLFSLGPDSETNLGVAKTSPLSFGPYHPANGLATRRPGFLAIGGSRSGAGLPVRAPRLPALSKQVRPDGRVALQAGEHLAQHLKFKISDRSEWALRECPELCIVAHRARRSASCNHQASNSIECVPQEFRNGTWNSQIKNGTGLANHTRCCISVAAFVWHLV